jgi:hypothetical protein
MNTDTAEQFSAVYAEAAIAFIETGIPQAVLWYEDEERWDFRPGDEEIEPSIVAFVLQQGWDGQLSLEEPTDIDDEHYDSSALRDEIELQMMDEGIAKAFIENLSEHRERLANGDDENDNDEESDDGEGDS